MSLLNATGVYLKFPSLIFKSDFKAQNNYFDIKSVTVVLLIRHPLDIFFFKRVSRFANYFKEAWKNKMLPVCAVRCCNHQSSRLTKMQEQLSESPFHEYARTRDFLLFASLAFFWPRMHPADARETWVTLYRSWRSTNWKSNTTFPFFFCRSWTR